VREQLTPERLGSLDESGAVGHGSHHAAEESGELTGQPGIQIRCPPASHAVEVIVERASVPRRARSRPAQIIGRDLGQDGWGALEALAQWAFHQLRSSPASSAFQYADLAGAEKESLLPPSSAVALSTNSRPCEETYGAGKTTTMCMLRALVKPTAGR